MSEYVQNHIDVLKFEVVCLQHKLRPDDTGHIHTAISVIKERIDELEKKMAVEIFKTKDYNI